MIKSLLEYWVQLVTSVDLCQDPEIKLDHPRKKDDLSQKTRPTFGRRIPLTMYLSLLTRLSLFLPSFYSEPSNRLWKFLILGYILKKSNKMNSWIKIKILPLKIITILSK